MKYTLQLLTISLLLPVLPVQAVDSHKECLSSKDYEGCMNHHRCSKVSDYEGCMRYNSPINSSSSSTSTREEHCVRDGFCIAGEGKDMLGMPKIKGWLYKEYPDMMIVGYFKYFKVNVRGSYGRYIQQKQVIRAYQSPEAGTAGTAPSSLTYGTPRTNCTGYDSRYNTTINCRTTPATTINLPGIAGRPATPGGNIQKTINMIYDCQDKTMGKHMGSRLVGKWKKYTDQSWSELCRTIDTLPESDFMKYVK